MGQDEKWEVFLRSIFETSQPRTRQWLEHCCHFAGFWIVLLDKFVLPKFCRMLKKMLKHRSDIICHGLMPVLSSVCIRICILRVLAAFPAVFAPLVHALARPLALIKGIKFAKSPVYYLHVLDEII